MFRLRGDCFSIVLIPKIKISTGSFKNPSQKRGRLSVKHEQGGTKNTPGTASPVAPEALLGRLVKTLPIFSS
jgi:hypothetical protein